MFKIEVEREADGRWIGEVPALPGVLVHGATAAEAGLALLDRGGDFADGVILHEAARAGAAHLVTFDRALGALAEPGLVRPLDAG